jgi:hypothetical protein
MLVETPGTNTKQQSPNTKQTPTLNLQTKTPGTPARVIGIWSSEVI